MVSNNRYRCPHNNDNDNGNGDDGGGNHFDPIGNNDNDDDDENSERRRRQRQYSNRSGIIINDSNTYNHNSGSSINNVDGGMKLRSNRIIGTIMTTVVCGGSPSKTTTGDDVENFQNQDSSFSLKSDQNGMKLLLFEDSIINANNSSTSDTFKSINNNRDSKIIIANNVKTTLGDKRKIPTRQQPKTPSTIHIPRQQQRRSSDDDQVIKAKSQNQFSNESTINQTNQRNKRSSSSTTTTNKQQTQDNNFAQKRRRLRRPIWNTNSTKKSTSSLSDVSYFEQQKQQKKIVTTTTTEEEDIDNHSIRSSSPMNICQSSSNDSDSGCMSSSYGESIQSPSTTPQQSIVVKSSMESSQSINGSNDNNGDNCGTLSSSTTTSSSLSVAIRTPPSTYDPNGFGVIEDQPEQNVHECREQDDEPK